MSNEENHLFWQGFQFGARLALNEAGVEDSTAHYTARTELLRQVRDGEVSLVDPEPRHPQDFTTSSSAVLLKSDREIAVKVMDGYTATTAETLRIADELDAGDQPETSR